MRTFQVTLSVLRRLYTVGSQREYGYVLKPDTPCCVYGILDSLNNLPFTDSRSDTLHVITMRGNIPANGCD